MKNTVLCTVLAVQAGCGSEAGQDESGAEHETPDVVLETLRIGGGSMQLYVDFGPDSAVLGFSVMGESGRRYFPIYASTYRGLPSATLEVFVSGAGDQMWIRSSWPGYDVLAHHRVGTDRCITRYGEISSFDVPTPDRLGGDPMPFPDMDLDDASRAATVVYDRENPSK